MSVDVSRRARKLTQIKQKGERKMDRPNVIGFYMEEPDYKMTAQKSGILKLFIGVEELNLAAIVSEYNEEGCMSEVGHDAIIRLLAEYDIDGIVVVTADDISEDPDEVREFLDMLSARGLEVVSIHKDLPEREDGKPVTPKRTGHCTVTVFDIE